MGSRSNIQKYMILEEATADGDSAIVNSEASSNFLFIFKKTGTGSCVLTFWWRILDSDWAKIPDDDGTYQEFTLAAGDQDGQVLISDHPGAMEMKATLSSTSGTVSVDCYVGAR